MQPCDEDEEKGYQFFFIFTINGAPALQTVARCYIRNLYTIKITQ
jgi:hypothetical protein